MLLDTLKQQTRQHHTQLEDLNGMPATQADYLGQLEAFYGFVAPWEEAIARVLPADDPIRRDRRKTDWLEADLAHFGYSSARVAELPRCRDLPAIDSRAAILGAAYVLEGATLGGQFISRHLEQNLGLSRAAGMRFFQSYGPAVGTRWQEFRQELLRHSSPAHDGEILRAAQDTFAKLHAWFAARKGVTV
jgi:heme oxygenase